MSPKERLERARDHVRRNLQDAAQRLSAEGFPLPALDGKVLRPLTAYILVPQELRSQLDLRFWYGALAVEMAAPLPRPRPKGMLELRVRVASGGVVCPRCRSVLWMIVANGSLAAAWSSR